MPKKLLGICSMFQKVWGNRKFFCIIGVSPFFVANFLSHSAEKNSWASLQCFGKYRVSKNFMHIRRVTIFRQNFSVSHCRKFLWRNLTVFEKKSGFEKISRKKSGGVSQFSVENIWSHMPKKHVDISWMFRKIWGNRKNLCMIVSITFFSQKFSVSQCRKLSWESLQCFEKFPVSKNFVHNTGYHVFSSKILCLTMPKSFVGIPSMFQKNSVIEKNYA